MIKITKEDRIYVRKNVYMFEVIDDGESILLNWLSEPITTLFPNSELDKMFDELRGANFATQFYTFKKVAEEKGWQFKEYDEKSWRAKKDY